MKITSKQAMEVSAAFVAVAALVWYLKNHQSVTSTDMPVSYNGTDTPIQMADTAAAPTSIGTGSFDPSSYVDSIRRAFPVIMPDLSNLGIGDMSSFINTPSQSGVDTAQKILDSVAGNSDKNDCGCGTGNNLFAQLTTATPPPYQPPSGNYFVTAPTIADTPTVYPPLPEPPIKDWNPVLGQYVTRGQFLPVGGFLGNVI